MRSVRRVRSFFSIRKNLLALAFTGASALTLMVSARPPAFADHVPTPPRTYTYNATFSTSNQGVWGPGTNVDLPSRVIQLASQSWNESGSEGGIESFAGFKFGADLEGASKGTVKLSTRLADVGPGSVDVQFPVQVTLNVPALDSFRAGQTIAIASDWNLESGHSMDLNIPRGTVDLLGDFKLKTHADLNVCFFGCIGTGALLPEIDLSLTDEEIASTNGTTLYVMQERLPERYTEEYLRDGTIGESVARETGVSGKFTAPKLSLTTLVGPDGKSLVATGVDTFVDLEEDFNFYLEEAANIHLGVSESYSGAEAEAYAIKLTGVTKITQNQQVTFAPTIRAKLSFPQAVQYTVRDRRGDIVASGTSANVTYDVGHTLYIVVPQLANGANMAVTPTFSIVPTFSNQGATVFDQSLVVDALVAGATTGKAVVVEEVCVPLVGCTPEVAAPEITVGLGPLYTFTEPIHSTTYDDVMAGTQSSWSLGGFGTTLGAAFVLNPQYTPLASISGPSTLDEGQEGSFEFTLSDADLAPAKLTYTYNWGDGSAPVQGANAPVSGFTFSDQHTYADNGTYKINLTVSDTHRIRGVATKTVTIKNVAPVLTHDAEASIDEDGTVTLTGTIHDEGIRDTFALTVNWGEGASEIHSFPRSATKEQAYTLTHRYLDDNPTNTAVNVYAITLSVVDKDGGSSGLKTRTLTVNNVAPTVFAGNNRTVDEGSPSKLGIDLFGKNLVTNPNAEQGTSGWTASAGFASQTYGPAGSGTAFPPVIAYRDTNGGGPSAQFLADESCFTSRVFDGSVENLDNNVRSIYVPATFVVYVYQDCNFGVLSHTLNGPGTFNINAGPASSASSLQVRQRTTFVTTSGKGYYNSNLGTLLDGTQPQFPPLTVNGLTSQMFTKWSGQNDSQLVRSPNEPPTNTLTYEYDDRDTPDNWSVHFSPTTWTDISFNWSYTGCHDWHQAGASIRLVADDSAAPTYSDHSLDNCQFAFQGHFSGRAGPGETLRINMQALSGSHITKGDREGRLTLTNFVVTEFQQDPDLGTNLAEPNLSAASAALGNWLTNPGSLNNKWSGLISIPQFGGQANSETAVIYKLDIPAGGAQIFADVGVDSGVFIWMDGTYKFGAVQPGGPPAGPNPYEYNVNLGFVSAGTHYVQFLREAHYGASTKWALNLTGITMPQSQITPQQAVDTAGPASRGGSYFIGGSSTPSRGTQTIDLSDVPTLVDTGGVAYNLSGFLGGITTESDDATFTATFLDESGGSIASGAIGPVTNGDRGNTTRLIEQTRSGSVPVGTRSILLTLQMNRGGSGSPANDGAADNLSFVLLPAPNSQLSAFFSDPGTLDTHTTTVYWGDGASETPTVVGIPGTYVVDGVHRYKDNGTYVVALTDVDDDTGQTTSTFTTIVRNVPPTVTGLEQVFLLKRSETRQVASFSDPGALDTHTSTINWGDGTATSTGSVSETLGVVAGVLTRGTVTGSHTYDVAGPFPKAVTAGVTVTDKDGGKTTIPVTMMVTDLEIPGATLTATNSTITENGSTSLTGRFNAIVFPSGATTFTPIYDYAWDFGDGTGTAWAPASASTNYTVAHSYLDNGSYTATFRVRAFEGTRLATLAIVSKTITVNNSVPVVTLSAVAGISENGTASLSGSFADAGSLDNHTIAINWGDGSLHTAIFPVVGTRTFSATHQYLDNNGTSTFNVFVTVTDNDGGAGTSTSPVVVANVSPASLTMGVNPAGIVESEFTTLEGSFTDPGTLDSHVVSIAWGDGDVSTIHLAPDVLSFSKAHQYVDGFPVGSYTVAVTVTDKDGAATSAVTTIGVSNSPPADLEASLTPNSIDEDESTDLSGSFTDRGTYDTHTVTVDWGDGSENDVIALPPGVFTFDLSHRYLDDNAADSYDVRITVTDKDGGATTITRTIAVANVEPELDAGLDQSVNEGDVVALFAEFDDHGTVDTHTVTIDWGDGSPVESVTPEVLDGDGTISAIHAYGEDGVFTVTVCVSDDDQAVPTCDTLTVEVANVAPTVGALADQSVIEGTPVAVAASFSDPGAADTHTATINWGDGTAVQAVTVLHGTNTVSGSHMYARNGAYLITICVEDADNAEGCGAFRANILNVPPTVYAGPDRTIPEGSAVNLNASFSDPGPVVTFTSSVRWGDGSAAVTTGVNQAARTVTGSHVYADNGSFTATLCVTDEDGATTCNSFTVTVTNAAPTVVPASGVSTYEAIALNLQLATFNDGGSRDWHAATINWGDGTSTSAGYVAYGPPGPVPGRNGTVSGAHVYANNGPYTATVCVTDKDGATSCGTLQVRVLGSRDLQGGVIGLLTPFAGESKSIEKAIEDVRASLATELWASDNRLDDKAGHKAFDHIRNAVQQLSQALKQHEKDRADNKKTLSPTAALAVQQAIDMLVQAAGINAQAAINEASATPRVDPKNTSSVIENIGKANADMSKGTAEWNSKDYDKAVDAFKKAWESAQKAMDKLVLAEEARAQRLKVKAETTPVVDPKNAAKVAGELADGNKNLAAGNAALASGDFNRAEAAYRKAQNHFWQAISQAMK